MRWLKMQANPTVPRLAGAKSVATSSVLASDLPGRARPEYHRVRRRARRYRQGLPAAMRAVGALIRHGGHAVKLEGVDGHEDVIRQVVGSGVPVMGHVGLTPQSVNQFGGYRVQGRDAESAAQLVRQARALEDLGCFSIVVEAVPADVAARITEAVAMARARDR